MKLKYYLRGVGIGIIFATFIMTVSSFLHRYNLSDEYIIKEARKLGMVMQDEVKDNGGLWGSDDSEDVLSEMTEETEETEASETEEVSESESTPAPIVPQEPAVPETPAIPETPVIPDEPVINENSDYVTIVVVSGDTPRKVGEKLVAAGIIEDEEDFMNYMGEHGYAYKLRRGTYSIPKEATFEEICSILFV